MDDDAIIAFEKGEVVDNDEVSPENLARAEEWENSMGGDDVPEFAGEWSYPTTEASEGGAEEEPIKRNEIVADASAALLYGVNGIAQKAGIEATMNAVEKLDVDRSEYPMWDLMVSAGIDTKNEIGDVRNANKMTADDINDYCNNNVNAPVVVEKSKEGERKALKDLQEMIQWAKTSSECAKLRDEAKSRDENLFKYATNDKPERGMVQMLEVLGQQREEKPKEEKPGEEVVEVAVEEPKEDVVIEKGFDENGNLVEVVVKKDEEEQVKEEKESSWEDIID